MGLLTLWKRYYAYIDVNSYGKIIVALSGGKDSLACLLLLVEMGVDMSRVELWHHDIDGRDGKRFMDWPCTPAYCRALAEHFGVPIYFSWKEGGFLREMLRENQRTAPTLFEEPTDSGIVVRQKGGVRGKLSTRRKFPQQTANLSQRWCSAYLKIDVGRIALRNQDRFRNEDTLFITGEAGYESTARSKYAEFEIHSSDARNSAKLKRKIDHWRPIHKWERSDVWAIIARHRIMPHPAYYLGWGRVSCLHCIFGDANQWASGAVIAPHTTNEIATLEDEFGVTISRSGRTVAQQVERGKAYEMLNSPYRAIAMSEAWDEPIQVQHWELPMGAFGSLAGPT